MLISLGPRPSQGEGRVNADPSLFGLFSNSGVVIEVTGTCGASLEGGGVCSGWVVRGQSSDPAEVWKQAAGSLPGRELGVQRGTLWGPAKGLDTELGSF